MHTFHSSPPPIECGWMLTRVVGQHKSGWRWWNGCRWSPSVTPKSSGAIVTFAAGIETLFDNDEIQWSLYYPPNARVPESEARVFKESRRGTPDSRLTGEAQEPDESSAFRQWFQSEQGKPYEGMWEFARAAWMARAATTRETGNPASAGALGVTSEIRSVGRAEQALRNILAITRRYLPPSGPSAHDAMSEIIAEVDPWPLESEP